MGIHVVNDQKKYQEWEFVYDIKNDKTTGVGQMHAATAEHDAGDIRAGGIWNTTGMDQAAPRIARAGSKSRRPPQLRSAAIAKSN